MLETSRLFPCEIGKLTHAEIEETAALLSEAFAENPSYAYMHPRKESRARDLHAFFTRNLLWHVPLNLTWVARDHGRVIGTATLEPPSRVQATLRQGVAHWIIPTLRDQGLHTLSRILWADRAFSEQSRRAAGGLPYWHVHAVAISPRAQGRGVGTLLMRRVLSELVSLRRREPSPVVLSTQKLINLRFYERLSFQLVDKVVMGRSKTSEGFDSWLMRLRGT